MRKLSKITALVMAFILFVTVSPMWSLNVNATENNNPGEQTQQTQQQEPAEGQDDDQQQGQDDDQQQGQGDDQQQAQNDESQGQQGQEGQAGQEQQGQEGQIGQEQQPENPGEGGTGTDSSSDFDSTAGAANIIEQQSFSLLRAPASNNIANTLQDYYDDTAEGTESTALNAPMRAAANPGEGEGDGNLAEGEEDEPEEHWHTIALSMDGTEGVSAKIKFSYDNGSSWYSVFGDGDGGYAPLEVDYDEEGRSHTYYQFTLEEIQAPEAEGIVLVDIEFQDEPNSEGYETKIIAYACENPWDAPENQTDITNLVIGAHPTNADPESLWDPSVMRYEYTIEKLVAVDYHPIGIAFDYPLSGKKEIIDESSNYIYAYSTKDFDNEEVPISDAFATELYGRFISGMDAFGLFGLVKCNYFDDPGAFYAQANELRARSRIVDFGQINVIEADGNTTSRNYHDYQVNWGFDEKTGEPIQAVYRVIELNDPEEILFCPDMIAADKIYYSRLAHSDQVEFTADGEDVMWAVPLYDIQIGEAAAIGGNGASPRQVSNDEGGYYAADVNTIDYMEEVTNIRVGTRVRLMNTNDTYVAIRGGVEGKAYGGLGLNGTYLDTVWRTGENAEATVYIGDKTIFIEPLIATGVNDLIASVELVNTNQKDGVSIDASDLNKIKVTFASNFYDVVPLKITYTNGAVKQLTIIRTGIMIQYSFLMDYGPGVQQGELWNDYRFNDKVNVSYDYNSGEQVIVYAVYYHPSNDATASGGDDLYLNIEYDDGHREIIGHKDSAHNFDGYLPETENEVAATMFLIGFAHAKSDYDENMQAWVGDNISHQIYTNKYGNQGGFSVTVLNAGYNSTDIFGGTQEGSGKGVYWDGSIDWEF